MIFPPSLPSFDQVKFNPGRSDNMIIQSIALLDQLDKDLNTFAMRVREWYCWHFPELRDLVKDNYVFARCASYIQDRTQLNEEKLPGLTEITMDEDVSKSILTAARSSMGMDCSAFDMVNIVAFTNRMVKLAEYRKDLHSYLLEKVRRDERQRDRDRWVVGRERLAGAAAAADIISMTYNRLTRDKLFLHTTIYITDVYSSTQLGHAHWWDSRRSFNCQGRLANQFGEMPGLHGADPGRWEGGR